MTAAAAPKAANAAAVRGDGGGRPQFRDTERRDMMGGQDNRGQRRSEFQADQRPANPPQARPAPAAAPAAQAPQVRERPQFRGGNDGGNRANRDVAGRMRDAERGGDGVRDNNRRGDGVRGDAGRGDGIRGDGARDGRRDNDRRDDDRGRRGDGRDWNGRGRRPLPRQ